MSETTTAPSTQPNVAPDKPRISGFRPDIEGLRAIAVLSVLVYHLRSTWLPGGFAGVDIFFVISGFLITSHLIREWQRDGRISLTRFYARRMVRLVPAATLALVATAVGTVLFVPRYLWEQIGTDIAGAAAYVVNWLFAARSVDYLAEDAVESPVQHFWSLAVEEQYYVIWPLLIIAACLLARRLRVGPRAAVATAGGIVIVVSFGAALVAIATGDVTAYFSTVTRLWELAVGAAVAAAMPLIARLSGTLAARIGYAVGIALLIASVVLITGEADWPGPLTLMPVLGTALAIAFGGGGTLLERVVSLRPLVWIGGISYSLYLWHWPIIVISGYVFDVETLPVPTAIGVALLSVLLAWASVRFFENPIRFSSWAKARSRNGLALGLSLGAFSVVLGLVLSSLASSGELDAQEGAEPEGAAVLASRPSEVPLSVLTRQPGWVLPQPIDAPDDVPELYADDCQQEKSRSEVLSCDYGDLESDRTIAIVGDSKANQWLPAVDRIASDAGYRVVVMTKSACGLSDARGRTEGGADMSCAVWNENVDREIEQLHPDVVLTSMVAKDAYTEGADVSPQQAMSDGLASKLERIGAMGIEVVVMADTPHPPSPVYQCVAENPEDVSACAFPLDQAVQESSVSTQVDAVERLGGTVLRAGREGPAPREGAPVLVDMTDFICPPAAADGCPAVIGNALIYRQGSHITATYVETMTVPLRKALCVRVRRERARARPRRPRCASRAGAAFPRGCCSRAAPCARW